MKMKKVLTLIMVLLLCVAFVACGNQPAAPAASTDEGSESAAAEEGPRTLTLYCSEDLAKPVKKVIEVFSAQLTCAVDVAYENAAGLQAKIADAKAGDFALVGSDEDLELIKEFTASSKALAKHTPVLVVAAENPKGITGIADLSNPDLTVAVGDPAASTIGRIADKALTDLGVKDSANLSVAAASSAELAALVASGDADAAIVWKEDGGAEGIAICETDDLKPYVTTVSLVQLNFADVTKMGEAFQAFLGTAIPQNLWKNNGFTLAN